MAPIRHFLLAVQFFTRIPVTGRLARWVGYSPAMLRASAAHFPGVGWLVALVAGQRILWAVPVALFFSIVNVGSVQLPISLQMDSSLSGVLLALLVLFVLMFNGIRQRMAGHFK